MLSERYRFPQGDVGDIMTTAESKVCEDCGSTEDLYHDNWNLRCRTCWKPYNERAKILREPSKFFDAIMKKFRLVASEENKTLSPWKDFDYFFLYDRLKKEFAELQYTIFSGLHFTHEGESTQDELIDVAAVAMFLWIKIENELASSETKNGDK